MTFISYYKTSNLSYPNLKARLYYGKLNEPVPIHPTTLLRARVTKRNNYSDFAVQLSPSSPLVFDPLATKDHIHFLLEVRGHTEPLMSSDPGSYSYPLNISPEGWKCTYDALQDVKQGLGVNTAVRDWASGKKAPPVWKSSDIPTLGDGSPSLLLHDLGDLTDSPAVTNLFQVASVRLFINASGSSKTRVLLEGLCKYWGLYFVCGSETAYSLGLRDLTAAIQTLDGRSGFLDSPLTTTHVDTNVSIATQSLRAVYAA